MFQWILICSVLLMMWHPSWHWLYAGVIAVLLFPLKKLVEWMEENFWRGFKAGFLKSFKQTEFGKAYMETYEKKKAEQDAKLKAEFPDYKPEE
jgi:hypothetical protein